MKITLARSRSKAKRYIAFVPASTDGHCTIEHHHVRVLPHDAMPSPRAQTIHDQDQEPQRDHLLVH
jgi:hypothetical protein